MVQDTITDHIFDRPSAISPIPSTKPGKSVFNVHVFPSGTVTLTRLLRRGIGELFVFVFCILQSFVDDGKEIWDVGVRLSQEVQLLFRVSNFHV